MKNDRAHGYSMHKFKDGSEYKGQMIMGKFEGKVLHKNNRGLEFKLLYEDGTFQRHV